MAVTKQISLHNCTAAHYITGNFACQAEVQAWMAKQVARKEGRKY
jgi:hypothetical protein